MSFTTITELIFCMYESENPIHIFRQFRKAALVIWPVRKGVYICSEVLHVGFFSLIVAYLVLTHR